MTAERVFAVYKYPLVSPDETFDALAGPVVRVGRDPQGVPCVWILGDKTSSVVRRFIVVGTGHDLPAGQWDHRGSWMTEPFVWHCFEAGEHL